MEDEVLILIIHFGGLFPFPDTQQVKHAGQGRYWSEIWCGLSDISFHRSDQTRFFRRIISVHAGWKLYYKTSLVPSGMHINDLAMHAWSLSMYTVYTHKIDFLCQDCYTPRSYKWMCQIQTNKPVFESWEVRCLLQKMRGDRVDAHIRVRLLNDQWRQRLGMRHLKRPLITRYLASKEQKSIVLATSHLFWLGKNSFMLQTFLAYAR